MKSKLVLKIYCKRLYKNNLFKFVMHAQFYCINIGTFFFFILALTKLIFPLVGYHLKRITKKFSNLNAIFFAFSCFWLAWGQTRVHNDVLKAMWKCLHTKVTEIFPLKLFAIEISLTHWTALNGRNGMRLPAVYK